MKRVIKAVYLNQLIWDISTLENEASIEEIQRAMEITEKEPAINNYLFFNKF
jgi:acetyl-CoA synthetase